jgi:hypothetical protein
MLRLLINDKLECIRKEKKRGLAEPFPQFPMVTEANQVNLHTVFQPKYDPGTFRTQVNSNPAGLRDIKIRPLRACSHQEAGIFCGN